MQKRSNAVNVLAKAAQVLKACHRLGGGLSLGEIAREVDLPRSTVQRIVQTLVDEGLLASGGTARSIALGPELLAMGAASANDIVERTHALLKDLARQTGETVDLSRLNRDHAVFVNQVPGSHRLQAVSAIGNAFPLHCTANGKAMLALLPPEDLQPLLMRPLQVYTPRTLASTQELTQNLAEVRRSGIAIDNEEHTLGICAVGTAFMALTRQIYAVSIPVPAVRFPSVRKHCEAVLREAMQDMGWLFTGDGGRG